MSWHLKTLKDALKARVVALVPARTLVEVAAVDPRSPETILGSFDWLQAARVVVIHHDSAAYGPTLTDMVINQESEWLWSLFVRVGHAGGSEDAIDEADSLLNTLLTRDTGLPGYTLTAAVTSPLELRSVEHAAWVEGSLIYRVRLWCYRSPTA